MDKYDFVYEKRGSGGIFITLTVTIFTQPRWESSQHAPSMSRLQGSMATSRVRGHGERLLLSANEVGTWGSVSPRISPSSAEGGAGQRLWMAAKWHQCHLYSSSPWPLSCALWEARRITAIRLCPVGKIATQKSLPPVCLLIVKCVHMQIDNRPTSPVDGVPPYLPFRSLIDCLSTSTVCVALYLLVKWPVIDAMLFCFLRTN